MSLHNKGSPLLYLLYSVGFIVRQTRMGIYFFYNQYFPGKHDNYILERHVETQLLVKSEDVPKIITNFELFNLLSLLNFEEHIFHPALYTITFLDLSYCGLSDLDLPRTLQFLQLRNLNLSHNKLVSVPQCLYEGNLGALQSLDLSYNSITQFDVGPNCILNLKILRLQNNCLKNVPPWFLEFRCLSLEELNYSENKVQHYDLLQYRYNFSKAELTKLELKNSCLVDSDILWLKCFKLLQFLDISNDCLLKENGYINRLMHLDELFVEAIWNDMKILKLNYLDIPFFPEGIFCIESLTKLYISHNDLSWFPDGIEYLINLEYLDISFNDLIILPKEICKLVKLKVLIASTNNLYECPLMPVNLEILDLYDNDLNSLKNINFDSITNMDLDFNYISMKDQNFRHAEYCLKRDQFRIMYNIKNRFDDSKQLEEFDGYSSDGCEYNGSDDLLGNNNFVSYLPESCEDWDKEYDKHPDITLSDDEYNGEHHLKKMFNKPVFVYYDDEEWMYTDAD